MNAAIVVNSVGDGADPTPTDGVCASSAGSCTLRAAIATANGNPGPDTINFAIPGTGPHLIKLATGLPAIDDSGGRLRIDGYSQSGSSVNTASAGSNAKLKVQVVGPADGTMFTINSAGNEITGLATYGARIVYLLEGEWADGNRFVGNFIGTNAAGTYENPISVGGGDTGVGLLLQTGASQNVIGAPGNANRNIISGNGGYGIRINHGASHSNVMQNNVVGLNPSITGKLRQWHGIDFQWWTWGNLIGGYNAGEANLIGGQINRGGVELSHDARSNLVIGNLIGTMPDGNSVSSFSGNTYGVTLKDGPRENYVANNVIGGNVSAGIWGKHNYTPHNTFVNNRIGVGSAGASIPNGKDEVFLTGNNQTWYGNIIGPSPFRVLDYRANDHYFAEPAYTSRNEIIQGQHHLSAKADVNVALGKSARQSSLSSGGVPERAVDGNTSGNWRDGSITHSAYERSPWWEVDLGSEFPVNEIKLYNRSDCCVNRLSNGTVFASTEPFGNRTLTELKNDPSVWQASFSTPPTAPFAVGVDARYVRVQLSGSGYLSLAEVEVMGPATTPLIDIDPVELNPNDPRDADDGPHDMLNRPLLTGVGPGAVFGEACAGCTVEVYGSGAKLADGSIDPSRSGTAGMAWIGTAKAGTDGSFSLASSFIQRGRLVSALAIDAFGNTSELPRGRKVPSVAGGVTGTAAASLPKRAEPTPLPLPEPYVHKPSEFTCSFDGGTLSWSDMGDGVTYYAWAILDGKEQYLGGVTGTSLKVPAADQYRVQNWITGREWNTSCAGDGVVAFSCSYTSGTLKWADAGAAEYYVFSTTGGHERYLGPVKGTSLAAGAADSYRVEHWVSGSRTSAACDGPGVAAFTCSYANGTLSWTNVGANAYYAFATTGGVEKYLGPVTGTSLATPRADSFRVEHWANGPVTNATCSG